MKLNKAIIQTAVEHQISQNGFNSYIEFEEFNFAELGEDTLDYLDMIGFTDLSEQDEDFVHFTAYQWITENYSLETEQA